MQANRRSFLRSLGVLAAGLSFPVQGLGVGSASQIQISQLVYPGGNWRPRPTALRRLAWEIHKRTAVETALEPTEVKPVTRMLATSPIAYMSGDRPFPKWRDTAVHALGRFIKLGGTLIIDPAVTTDGDPKGLELALDGLIEGVVSGTPRRDIPANHVLYRTFYQISRPVGRVEGPSTLSGYEIDGRFAVIRSRHDLGGAWARDNLGNWEFDVVPGGERQRETAFRLGVNMVLYSLCLDYKDEEPHRRFNPRLTGT
ncbi:MAG: DUF4159 domain-containing protein [Deltaproteobacteria bacterium]|nr:DUF4159 domain-containing protein [Deltaproteobacteria bacterium]